MRRDWPWLLALMIFGLIPRLYTLGHTTVASRDCVNFIQLAINLDDPEKNDRDPCPRIGVLQKAEHPPGYSVALLGMAYLAKGTTVIGPDAWMQVGQLVSIVAGCWLVVPVYFLGKNAFNRGTGLIAAALATALPTLAEITADALSDGLFLAVNVTALACIQKGLGTNRWDWWLAAGALGGTAYLVRPEGALCIVAASVMLVGLFLRHRLERKQSAMALLTLTLGFAAVAGPYIVTIGKLTNKRSGGQLLGEPRAERGPLFAAFVLKTDGTRIVSGAKLAITEPLRATNYGIGILGLLGAISLRKNRAAAFLLVQVGLGFLLLGYLGFTVGYVSRRHALTIAIIASVFAAAFLQWWAGNVCKNERRSLIIAVLVLLAVSYPFNFKHLHPNREPHRAAGLWVAENIPANVYFIDPYTWAGFYAGRTTRSYMPDPNIKYAEDRIYVLLEPNNPDPGSPLTHIEFAKELAAKGTIIKQWPEDLSSKNAVAIYLCPLPKKP